MTTKTFNQIAAEYAPYHTMKEFAEGYADYLEHRYQDRYRREDQGLQAQAWDRGMEAAMRFTRQFGGL
jgi:hypothetical protein